MSRFDTMPMHACRHEGNPLAVAAFICSLIGFFTGGILSPVGVILALFALGKHPRGFAVAALVLGLLGSACISGIILTGVLATVLAAVGIVGTAAAVSMTSGAANDQAAHDLSDLDSALRAYYQDKQALPEHLGLLVPEYYHPAEDRAPLTDPWSKPYRYEISEDGGGFTVRSDGPDAKPGTEDDVASAGRVDSTYAPEAKPLARPAHEVQHRRRSRTF